MIFIGDSDVGQRGFLEIVGLNGNFISFFGKYFSNFLKVGIVIVFVIIFYFWEFIYFLV